MRVIIAAAGTAGHINPGIAIANKIKKESPSSEVMFLGTDRGLENDLVPRAGYTLKTIEAYGLSINGIKSFKNNLKTLKGIGEAKKIVKEFKPDIIIGTGGYICGAAILAGKRYKVPTMLHESNAFPGKAVKMLSKKVDTILISFEDARKELPNAKNIVLTGTPTKIKNLGLNKTQKEEVLRRQGLKANKPVVLVFGGSQGAKAINDAITNLINKNLNKDYQIMWAPGPLQFDIVKRRIKNLSKQDQLKIVPYIYNMEEIMNSVDLVIARSGAMTITELSIVGKPAIFVPLPNVSNNHQEYNAKVLEKVGAARIIHNKDLNEEVLNNEIEDILNTPSLAEKMSKNAQTIAISNVEDKIYEEIKKLIK
jgi:UDP-N-acetylglucosamine--N-acetylmuramyl-(pentapeptide) pyrophosphoryl-undecaprenol N-acetylglucosamine transferase